jgi:hypothetical protein
VFGIGESDRLLALNFKTVINKQDTQTTEMGPSGVARKFWSVPMELLHEEKGYSVGNIFSLFGSQAIIFKIRN